MRLSFAALAAQLGGGFILSSEPAKGTRADLYLPVAQGSAVSAPRQRDDAPEQGRALSILLVDDEKLVRQGVGAMLRDLGHKVKEAAGGPEARRPSSWSRTSVSTRLSATT